MSNKVVLYGKNGCSQCTQLHNKLNDYEIEHEYIILGVNDTEPVYQAMDEGIRSIPYGKINGIVVDAQGLRKLCR